MSNNNDDNEEHLSDATKMLCLEYLRNVILPPLHQNEEITPIKENFFLWIEQNCRKILLRKEQEDYFYIKKQQRNGKFDIAKKYGQLKQQQELEFVEYIKNIEGCNSGLTKRFIEKYGFDKFMLYSRNKEYQDEHSYHRDKIREKYKFEKINKIKEKIKNQNNDELNNILTLVNYDYTLDFFSDNDDKVYNIYYYYFTNNNILDITKFKNIVVLDVSNSDLSYLPKEINNLYNLKALMCENNKISKIEPIYLPNLVIACFFNNKLKQFPQIESPLKCLHIGKNNIVNIPYKKILEKDLIVFLYFDNPFDDFKNNEQLRWLELHRQKYLLAQANLSLIYDLVSNKDELAEYVENKKINITFLKGIEEDIFGEFYMNEFMDRIICEMKQNI
jgi:hypothetical protein